MSSKSKLVSQVGRITQVQPLNAWLVRRRGERFWSNKKKNNSPSGQRIVKLQKIYKFQLLQYLSKKDSIGSLQEVHIGNSYPKRGPHLGASFKSKKYYPFGGYGGIIVLQL